jgi:ubiquitin conjugation factor E4 B
LYHLKFDLRIPILALFEELLPLAGHRKRLFEYAHDRSGSFAKFMNHLLQDSTHLLDEGLDSLMELRKDDGRDDSTPSRPDGGEHCRSFFALAKGCISTLARVSEEAVECLVAEPLILTQLVHNFLGPLLDKLVGPKCMALKAKDGRNDFAEYEFDPRDLLVKVAGMYVRAAAAAESKVTRLVLDDPSFRIETFRKAVRILAREQLGVKAFAGFVEGLSESSALDIDWPDEFLDPLMAEVMRDPVELPSGNVVDRQVALRIIMNGDYDPFTKVPMGEGDLKPRNDVRERLDRFCAERGIVLGD